MGKTRDDNIAPTWWRRPLLLLFLYHYFRLLLLLLLHHHHHHYNLLVLLSFRVPWCGSKKASRREGRTGRGSNSKGGLGRKECREGGREGRREDEQEAGRVNIQSKGGFGNDTHLGTYQVEGRDRGIPPMVLSLVLVPASRSAHALAAAVYSSFFLCSILLVRWPLPLCV
jgi:hypothetical protein